MFYGSGFSITDAPEKDFPFQSWIPFRSILLVALFLCTGGAPFVSAAVPTVRSLEVIGHDSGGRQFSYPGILFFDEEQEEVYLSDEGNGQVVLLDSGFYPLLEIGAGRGLSPVYGACVWRGHLFAAIGPGERDRRAHIAEFDRALLPVRKIYFDGFKGAESFIPRDFVMGEDGTFYVAGVNASPVVVIDSQGRFRNLITPRSERLGIMEAAPILALTRDRSGRLYFLSEEFGKIFVYGPDENFLYSFGEKGGIAGKLARPRGIAVDEVRDRIYVVDYLRHAVSAFTLKGVFLFEFGGMGSGRGWLRFPTDVCVDRRGRIWVSDTFNRRIQVFGAVEEEVESVDPSKEASRANQNASEGDDGQPEEKLSKPAEEELRRVEESVRLWAEAWRNQDVEKYLSFYSARFRCEEYLRNYAEANGLKGFIRALAQVFGGDRSGEVRRRWEAFRRRQLNRHAFIRLDLGAIRARMEDGVAVASFDQRFASDGYEDVGTKTLVMELEEGEWKIREERFARSGSQSLQ